MKHALGGVQLALLLMFVAVANSLICFKCATGDCKEPYEEEECGAAVATTAAAAAFIERQADSTAAPADFKCVIFKGKKGSDSMVYRGCSDGGTCAEFKGLIDDAGECTPCDTDKCNSGQHIKPTSFFVMLFVSLTCLAYSCL